MEKTPSDKNTPHVRLIAILVYFDVVMGSRVEFLMLERESKGLQTSNSIQCSCIYYVSFPLVLKPCISLEGRVSSCLFCLFQLGEYGLNRILILNIKGK